MTIVGRLKNYKLQEYYVNIIFIKKALLPSVNNTSQNRRFYLSSTVNINPLKQT